MNELLNAAAADKELYCFSSALDEYSAFTGLSKKVMLLIIPIILWNELQFSVEQLPPIFIFTKWCLIEK